MADLKFSIIIPVFNREHTIGRSINSILVQNPEQYEVLVVDDGSTDQSASIINTFIEKHPNFQIRYYRKENAERGAARNYGVQHARGEYVSFLDSDDLLKSNWFEAAWEFTNSHPEAEWFHMAYELHDSKGKKIGSMQRLTQPANRHLIEGNPLSCLGVFVKRDIALLNPFNENRELSGFEDWELWLRLASKYQLPFSNKVIGHLILHDKRSVLNKDVETLIRKANSFIELVQGNKNVMAFMGKRYNWFLSSLYSYLALHLVLMKNQRTLAIRYLLLSLRLRPGSVFKRRFPAILKHWF